MFVLYNVHAKLAIQPSSQRIPPQQVIKQTQIYPPSQLSTCWNILNVKHDRKFLKCYFVDFREFWPWHMTGEAPKVTFLEFWEILNANAAGDCPKVTLRIFGGFLQESGGVTMIWLEILFYRAKGALSVRGRVGRSRPQRCPRTMCVCVSVAGTVVSLAK